jgi:hypothetical protein
MPKPYIKYKIISSSRSWDICYESVNKRTDGQTRWLQYSPLSMSGGIMTFTLVLYMCVRGVNFTSVSWIFLLKCETITTVQYFLFLFLILSRTSVRLSVCPHFRNRYLSFYWKKWFYIWYMALAWWLVPCLPFPGLPHIYFLFTARLRIFHVCRNGNFRNRYLSFYWKKWFYIWYVALAWWLVPCLPFPGLLHIYFLFTVWLEKGYN